MLRSCALVATALCIACPSSSQLPRAPDDRALRIQIAHAEALRGGGVVELVEIATRGQPHARALALRGLGRIGGSQAITALSAAADDRDGAVKAAAIGGLRVAALLDEVGRHKLVLSAAERSAFVAASHVLDRAKRYAATYALAREYEPPADDAVATALAARIGDDDPEIRATAITGLVKRNAVVAGRTAIEDALRDRDWRVEVEAVRALAGENGDDAGRDAVAAILSRALGELERGDAPEAHVVIEALRQLQAHGARPGIAAAIAALAPSDHSAPLARGWIDCLATSAIQRAAQHPDVDAIARCGHDRLPDHLRLPLLAELVTAGAGDVTTHRAALRILLSHPDPRVRAAGLGALAATWNEGDDNDHRTILQSIIAGLGSQDPIIAGAAVEAAPALLAASGSQPALEQAIRTRAASEREAELSSSLYEIIGKTIPGAADVCRAGLAGPPVSARAAAECLRALGEAVPAPAIAAASPPPVDVAEIIGRDLRWHVITSRGEIVIALRPDVAPWNVATIVALTRRGFYDHLEFHRVVPDFVVQGGDPTMSGLGGPGFTTPAEPATGADGPGFVAGGIGMADAGRDTGGSQWFVMHSHAPHLDGRYSWVGNVVSGQNVADSLLIGDRVERATIEVR